MTYDEKVSRIYVDSNKVGEFDEGGLKFPVGHAIVYAGTGESPGVHATNAIVDEVVIFNKALNEERA